MLRLLFATFTLCCFSNYLFAQIGYIQGTAWASAPDWEAILLPRTEDGQLLDRNYTFELDYRLRPIADYRIEFFPTFAYTRTNGEARSTNLGLQQAEFQLRTNIYFLSLEADCDCPTFSREAGLLKKGLFFQVAPGIARTTGKLEAGSLLSEFSAVGFRLGAGLGLEIGLSDYFTLAPVVRYDHYFAMEWDDLAADWAAVNPDISLPPTDNQSAIGQWYAGLRLGIRFGQ